MHYFLEKSCKNCHSIPMLFFSYSFVTFYKRTILVLHTLQRTKCTYFPLQTLQFLFVRGAKLLFRYLGVPLSYMLLELAHNFLCCQISLVFKKRWLPHSVPTFAALTTTFFFLLRNKEIFHNLNLTFIPYLTLSRILEKSGPDLEV